MLYSIHLCFVWNVSSKYQNDPLSSFRRRKIDFYCLLMCPVWLRISDMPDFVQQIVWYIWNKNYRWLHVALCIFRIRYFFRWIHFVLPHTLCHPSILWPNQLKTNSRKSQKFQLNTTTSSMWLNYSSKTTRFVKNEMKSILKQWKIVHKFACKRNDVVCRMFDVVLKQNHSLPLMSKMNGLLLFFVCSTVYTLRLHDVT